MAYFQSRQFIEQRDGANVLQGNLSVGHAIDSRNLLVHRGDGGDEDDDNSQEELHAHDN